MPRYRLLEQHYSEEDKLLDGDKEANEEGKGTIVGDGTPHKWTRPPTPAMVGLDKESQALVDKEKLRGSGLNPIDFLPLSVGGPDTTNDDAILGALRRALGAGNV